MKTNTEYESTTITLPVGLKAEARKRGLNVSGVCADALTRRVLEVDRCSEFEAWKKSHQEYQMNKTPEEEKLDALHDELRQGVKALNKEQL